jgi:hypothetical protein
MTVRKLVSKLKDVDSSTVRFQVFTATGRKMAVLWDVALCCLVRIGRRFRGAYCFHHRPTSIHSQNSKDRRHLLIAMKTSRLATD